MFKALIDLSLTTASAAMLIPFTLSWLTITNPPKFIPYKSFYSTAAMPLIFIPSALPPEKTARPPKFIPRIFSSVMLAAITKKNSMHFTRSRR